MYKRSKLMKILAVSIVLLFLASGFSAMDLGFLNSNEGIKQHEEMGSMIIRSANEGPFVSDFGTNAPTTLNLSNSQEYSSDNVILNLLNNNTLISPNMGYYNINGYLGNEPQTIPNYPTLLTGFNDSYFWPFNQSVLMCAYEGNVDSTGHNAGIFTYKENFNGFVTINSIVAITEIYNTTQGYNGVFAAGDGVESYLFLNPVYIQNSTDEYKSYAQFYYPQGDVIFPYSSSPYIVVQWDDWRHYDGSNTFNLYIVHPEKNGTVSAQDIDAIGQFGTFIKLSNSTINSSNYEYYLFNFNISYSSLSNNLSASVSYHGMEEFLLSLNLSGYNFTAPQAGEYGFGNGASGATNENIGYIYLVVNSKSIPPSYTIAFNERGLTYGTPWSVTLNGTTESSTTNTITFSEPNGTYTFEVSNVSGYTSAPSSGTVNINGKNEEINIIYTPVPKAVALFSDNFVSDSYINTTKWLIDSAILQNITRVEKSLFNENITLVNPPNLHTSFNQGLDLWANGYLNMAGITSSHAYTAPLSVNVNFSVSSIQGGNGMILLTNATGNNIIGIFISYQIWVQIGNNLPEQINYPISTGIIYSLSISLTPSSFNVIIRGGSSAYSQIFPYSPSGNQSNYLTLGSFVGTFPGQVYNPTSTPEMVFYNTSITSNASWNLSISAYSSSDNLDSGVNITVVNSFNNVTYEGITPNNGTIIFRGLVSGEYEIIAEQSQGSQSVLVTKYIQIGDPYDPSLHTLSISLTITPPPVPPLQASIYAMNSTVAMAPWENTFIAVPSGYVGNYSYQWYVNGQSVGSGLEINYTFTISGTKSINYSKVELIVTSQGTWFGNHESPESTQAEIEQIVYTEPIYLNLGVLSSNSYVSESFNGKDNYAVAFINGTTLELNANFIDTYLSNTIPPWLMSIIGISYPYWGFNISDIYGNQELNYVLQPGSMVQLNNITLPGIINSISKLQGFTFDVTLNPYALYAILGDVIQVVLSLIGVINALRGISVSPISLITPIVDAAIMTLDHTSAIEAFDLLTGSPVKIITSIVDGIIVFLEDLIPQLPHIIYAFVNEYAPSYLSYVKNRIGALAVGITKIFPAWKIFDLGFDLGTVIGAALRGDLNTRYGILSYNIPTVFRVNDPNSSLPYVTAIGQSVEGGWAGSWIGSKYAHSSFTAAGYSFALPSNQTFELNISNPSDTESIPYNISLSSSNYNETISGTLAPGSWQEYIVNTSSGSLSVSKVYRITFTESGLPSGTSWSVTLNNVGKSSTNGTIIFNEPNGTYSYIISGISGYRANAYSGTINVNGNPISVPINWTIITYTITITENGIPNGTSWSATLTGTTFNGQYINVTLSSTTNTITFNEPNGTYSYIIHLPSGYQSNSVKGQVNVSGNSAIATIKAQQIIKPQQTTNYLSIGIIAVVIIIVILLAVAFLIRNRNKQRITK